MSDVAKFHVPGVRWTDAQFEAHDSPDIQLYAEARRARESEAAALDCLVTVSGWLSHPGFPDGQDSAAQAIAYVLEKAGRR